MKFIDQIPRFALKRRFLVVVPLMVMSPLSAKPILVFSFDFGLASSEPLLVKIGESTFSPYTLLEVCPAHKDKIEIKCMGYVGGKTPTEPKFYSSLSLGTLNMMKLMFMCFVQLCHG